MGIPFRGGSMRKDFPPLFFFFFLSKRSRFAKRVFRLSQKVLSTFIPFPLRNIQEGIKVIS